MKIRSGGARVVLLAMLGAVGAAAGPAPDDLTIIGGHAYRFPRAVFQGGAVERGKVATILLQVKWPGMEGFQLQDMSGTDAPDSLLVLGLSNANGEPYLNDKLAAAERQAIEIAVAPYGKPGFPLHEARPGSEHGPVPDGGMIAVEAHPDGHQGADVFVSPSLDAPVELIGCNQAEAGLTAPQCDQQFVGRGMLLKVSYKRPMVGQWREIHAAVDRFLAAHEVTP